MSSPATTGRLPGFDWLRAAAIVAVVLIHVTDVALRKNAYFPEPGTEGIAYYLTSALLRFCVPTFFMMSAFLAERRILAGGPAPAARWKRFLFPLVVASVLYTGMSVVVAVALHKPLEPVHLAVMALTGRASFHTWFLMNLFVYALTHHFLRRLAGPARFAVFAIVSCVLFGWTKGNFGAFQQNDAGGALSDIVLGAPYYLTGIYAAQSLPALLELRRAFVRGLFVSGVVLACFFAVGLRERGFYNLGTALLSAGTFLVALHGSRPPPPAVATVGALSLGIYLWHPLFLTVSRLAQGRRAYTEVISPAITFALVLFEFAVSLAGGYLAAKLLVRFQRLKGLAQ